MGIKDIWAVRDSTVLFTGSYEDGSPYGNRVYIEDDVTGEILLYGHLDWFAVKAGDKLLKGDVFAEIGATGYCPSGAHIHMGMFKSGTPLSKCWAKNAIDPLPYFKKYGYPVHTIITNYYGSKIHGKGIKKHEGVDFSSWRKRDD